MKGIHLKAARIRRGLTQTELARRIQVPQSLISRLERGENRDTTSTTKERLAKELRVPVEKLQFGQPSEVA